MKNTHDIPINFIDGYALPLAANYDSVQECYETLIPPKLAERLEQGRLKALELHEGQGTPINFGGELFQIWSHGSKGNRWVIENDDFQLHFRTDKPGWNVSVRYLAPGLWEYGVDAIKERVERLIRSECTPMREDWSRLSRVDFAFDFHSPKFTTEMTDGNIRNKLVMTSGVKGGLIFDSKRDETLTLGVSKSSSIQIQVYDKGKEIFDKPGKEWFFKIWARAGYECPKDGRARDVWRLEVRFKSVFLKERNIRTLEKFKESLVQLLSEALMRRRVVEPDGTQHRERWPLHPFWAATWAEIGGGLYYIPVGRMLTQSREEYRELLVKQMAGLGRSISVLDHNSYDMDSVEQTGKDAIQKALKDTKHNNKILKCKERQRFIDEAK